MGRYAQRQRRGGGPPPGPPPVSFLTVARIDATDVLITFSGPAAADTVVGPDLAFDVDGVSVDSVSQAGPTTIAVALADPVGTGAPWFMAAQPNWITTPILVPASGDLV